MFYCWYVYGLRNKAKEQHYRRMALINDIRAATQYQQKDFGRYTKQLERGYQSTLPKSKNIKPITPETIEAKFGIKIRNKRKKVK